MLNRLNAKNKVTDREVHVQYGSVPKWYALLCITAVNYMYLWFDSLLFNLVLNRSQGICLEISFSVVSKWNVNAEMCYIIDVFVLVVFVMDCVFVAIFPTYVLVTFMLMCDLFLCFGDFYVNVWFVLTWPCTVGGTLLSLSEILILMSCQQHRVTSGQSNSDMTGHKHPRAN